MQLLSLGSSTVASVATPFAPPLATAMNDPSCCHAAAHLQEILSLSELPMDRLLRVRSVMHNYGRDTNSAQNRQGEPLPAAEALRSKVRFPDRSSSAPIKRQEIGGLFGGSGKQSKLATGFQLAITVLSFLAFGAYLISLVVAIVRNNNTTTSTTATTQQPFVLVPAAAGRRRRKRRRAAPEPPSLPGPPLLEPDSLFTGLATLAAAYAKFEGHELG
ncbi:uncharacterized protein LOC132200847 [Neocloeon triangulifer]|uniref:uncharacterized protein LOC132200847 n=1 Tax=Neocloeon triangulifer TaxID=2078957 RepID=UPI00286F9527|nr:uncharacterized protein LOC132200847 [Neocloeon triangulifer]